MILSAFELFIIGTVATYFVAFLFQNANTERIKTNNTLVYLRDTYNISAPRIINLDNRKIIIPPSSKAVVRYYLACWYVNVWVTSYIIDSTIAHGYYATIPEWLLLSGRIILILIVVDMIYSVIKGTV